MTNQRFAQDGGTPFAQIVIRKIDPAVKALLKRRAIRHGRTLPDEIQAILRDAVKEERQTKADRPAEGLGTRIADHFAGIGLTDEIPEWRGYSVRPAEFLSDRRVRKAAKGRVPPRSSRSK
jgi:antitoxin FitA